MLTEEKEPASGKHAAIRPKESAMSWRAVTLALIGWFEIVMGGCLALGNAYGALAYYPGDMYLVFLIVCVFSTALFVAGIFLLRHRRLGRILSILLFGLYGVFISILDLSLEMSIQGWILNLVPVLICAAVLIFLTRRSVRNLFS